MYSDNDSYLIPSVFWEICYIGHITIWLAMNLVSLMSWTSSNLAHFFAPGLWISNFSGTEDRWSYKNGSPQWKIITNYHFELADDCSSIRCPEKLVSNPGPGSKAINFLGWHGLDMSITVTKRCWTPTNQTWKVNQKWN